MTKIYWLCYTHSSNNFIGRWIVIVSLRRKMVEIVHNLLFPLYNITHHFVYQNRNMVSLFRIECSFIWANSWYSEYLVRFFPISRCFYIMYINGYLVFLSAFSWWFQSIWSFSQSIQWCNQCFEILLYFWWRAEKKHTHTQTDVERNPFLYAIGWSLVSSSKCMYLTMLSKLMLRTDFFGFIYTFR